MPSSVLILLRGLLSIPNIPWFSRLERRRLPPPPPHPVPCSCLGEKILASPLPHPPCLVPACLASKRNAFSCLSKKPVHILPPDLPEPSSKHSVLKNSQRTVNMFRAFKTSMVSANWKKIKISGFSAVMPELLRLPWREGQWEGKINKNKTNLGYWAKTF